MEMNISNNIRGKISDSLNNGISKVPSKSKWELTDSLKDRIVELAREDAQSDIYMGTKFMALRRAEVRKVVPDRAALIRMFDPERSANMKEIREADERHWHMLFGLPCEAKYGVEKNGDSTHIYNENGEEILTYTPGVGWHEKETRAESKVHSALKSAYYEAFHEARKSLKAGMGTASGNDSGICQSGFDMKA